MKNINKVIVITGGSDGLGLAITKELLANNTVVIISKDEEKNKKLIEDLKCDFWTCDITDYQRVDESIAEIIAHHGRIDVLINNAGVWLAGDPTENTYEQI